MVVVQVPATTANLGPGFDCIGAALGLYNIIEMEFSPQTEVYIAGDGENELLKDETNLVYKAAIRIFNELGIRKHLKVMLKNNIPISRGLGSSAACITGGMMAANKLSGNLLPLEKIMELATEMEGHPDNVVPALIGGFTISLFDNNKVIFRSFPISPELRFVVAIPQFHVSTQDARRVLPKTISFNDAIFNLSRAALLVASVSKGEYKDLDIICQDKLHQPYRSHLIPGFDKIIREVREKGAAACFLSGSGPSIIALALDNNADMIGQNMAKIFSQEGISANYKILSPSSEGVKFI